MESNTASSRRIKKTVYSKYSVLIYFLVFLTLVFIFYRYYDKYRDEKTREIQKGLISVAQLKIHEIDSWRFERIADGRVLRRNVIVPRVTEKILKGIAAKSDIDDILSSFNSFKTVYSYSEIKLIDTTGNILLSDGAGTQISSHVKNLIRRVLI
ncbi:MAG: hypothetical protein LWX07_13240, partial [Bacteroidetes bacterium]|nr:hypothetical protein [Bacteroidota bacterium]